MACTKQTSSRSNGGTAPLVSISDHESLKFKIKIPPKALPVRAHMDVCPPHRKNDFCTLCRDGVADSKTIYACNDCPRVMCTRCLHIPDVHVPELGQPNVTFRCILCHTALAKKLEEKVPYYGFYKDGNPVLPSFLPVEGQLEYSKRSQISTSPILIIHFKLVDHSTAGSPADMMHSFLQPYFPHDGLRLLDVVFDFGTARKIKSYSEQCATLVNDLEEEHSLVCIIITTHTDDTHGGPFVGRDKKNSYIAASVTQFIDTLLQPWHSVIQRAQESTLFFMGCGAIVNQPDAFRDLRSSVLESTFSSAVAFTAPHFQPSYTCHLALAYAELVLIEHFTIREAFPEILGQSYRLGMHTSIILMTRFNRNGAAALECTRYTWAHTKARPWGFSLPVQCPQCGCVSEWKNTYSSGVYIVECSYTGCGRNRGKGTASPQKYTFKCPRGAKRLKPGKRQNAEWLEIPLNFSKPNALTGFSDSE